jgi:hypothetical protein
MTAVVGIDISSRQLDLAVLEESGARAWHRRISLEEAGKQATAWERTLSLPTLMPRGSFWDDIYLVALEVPYGLGTGTVAVLNRIVGAIAASLPRRLQTPQSCWIVRPDEWKTELGLRGKPTEADIDELGLEIHARPLTQDARDALCLAYFARELNARAIDAA